MSIDIPCGSSNPIGHKMPPPSSPLPPPSSSTKSAVQKALQESNMPPHLHGDQDAMKTRGGLNTPKETNQKQDQEPGTTETKGFKEPRSTPKPGSGVGILDASYDS
ncbi:hypothetical protein TWF694_008532 [Orbilia ellipsospora]|uniref:Uncharacterized protein n=1 Tax=Orbilia ellipsospora TaxID=2528407 RepID=A0AAV9XHX2_9PEZI